MAKESKIEASSAKAEQVEAVLAKHDGMKCELHRHPDGTVRVFSVETNEYISRPKPEAEARERLTPSDGWVWA